VKFFDWDEGSRADDDRGFSFEINIFKYKFLKNQNNRVANKWKDVISLFATKDFLIKTVH